MSEHCLKIKSVTPAYTGFFELKLLTFQHLKYQGDWSNNITREVFQRGEAVVVLLYDLAQRQLILVEQCRAGAVLNHQKDGAYNQAWLLEPVAGMIDEKESAQEAGIREVQEETGAIIQSLEYVCQFYPSPGACNEQLHLYAAEVSSDSVLEYAGIEDEDEEIRVVTLGFQQALKMLLKAEFKVASTYIALQWFFFQKLAKSE